MSVTQLVTLGFYNSSQGVGMKWRLFLEEGWGSSLWLSGHSLDCHPQCQKKLWEASSLCSHELLCTVTGCCPPQAQFLVKAGRKLQGHGPAVAGSIMR